MSVWFCKVCQRMVPDFGQDYQMCRQSGDHTATMWRVTLWTRIVGRWRRFWRNSNWRLPRFR